ncbi:hypothetical protein HaLaN_01884 [Haematococcus lacustris]|uniref:Uncharacterized protein n=1 Tax=Haematococcus lacustris TaxID=44745 RepID=A0A699YCM2_HAELA|nr:hypothetical protein HaLaN_01884 [Haematococcus lacustris]
MHPTCTEAWRDSVSWCSDIAWWHGALRWPAAHYEGCLFSAKLATDATERLATLLMLQSKTRVSARVTYRDSLSYPSLARGAMRRPGTDWRLGIAVSERGQAQSPCPAVRHSPTPSTPSQPQQFLKRPPCQEPATVEWRCEAQADAGADEADAQLHQVQAGLQHREQQFKEFECEADG